MYLLFAAPFGPSRPTLQPPHDSDGWIIRTARLNRVVRLSTPRQGRLDLTRTPSKKERARGLLGRGYFPAELPPAFTTAELAKALRPLADAWGTASKAPPTQYDVFSIPRAGHARRNLALINPVSYLHLATFIAENWVPIRRFLRSSKYSKSTPEFAQSARRALIISSFDELELQRLLISSKFDYILRTDITRFYPSIYTHSVPWALHGKLWCKANLHSNLKGSLGDQMDALLRKCQDNQTIGIPIGPDTSRIAGEIIGVGIDSHLQKELKLTDHRAYRYIDDFYIDFNQNSECEQAIRVILKALLSFELDINSDKTSIALTAESIEPDWPYELRRFRFGKNAVAQRKSLEEYFHRALYIAKGIKFDNVLEYAIKRTRSVPIFRATGRCTKLFF